MAGWRGRQARTSKVKSPTRKNRRAGHSNSYQDLLSGNKRGRPEVQWSQRGLIHSNPMVLEARTSAAITVASCTRPGKQARGNAGVEVAPMDQIEDDQTAKLVRYEGWDRFRILDKLS